MAQFHADGMPYLRVTWIKALLAGEAYCEWAAWFQGQHDSRSWTRRPSTFDFETWRQEHTRALLAVREQYEQKGYTVTIEDQNEFRMRGKTAILVGKPDLIARKSNSGVIIDVKTGMQREADKVQVMLYMWAIKKLPRLHQNIVQYEGVVEYPGSATLSIPATAIEQEFHEALVALINRLASRTPRPTGSQPIGVSVLRYFDCRLPGSDR